MNIRLRIEHLILNGMELAPEQKNLLHEAVVAELSRLLVMNGLSNQVRHGGIRGSAPAPDIQWNPTSGTSVLGAQLGASIFAAVSGNEQRSQGHGTS